MINKQKAVALRSEIRNGYMDADGLVSPWPSPINPTDRNVSGNGLLYLSEYYVLLFLLGDTGISDSNQWTDTVRKCQIEKGLFKRSPDHPEQQGPDDYTGLIAASSLLNQEIAKEILEYGETHYFTWWMLKFRYYWNNANPTDTTSVKAWLGRQQQLVALMQWIANGSTSVVRQAWWFVVITTSGLIGPKDGEPGYEDSWILSWLNVIAVSDRTWLTDLACLIWEKRLLKRHPEGMKEIFRRYFSDNHPFVKYFPDKFIRR